MCLLVQNVEKIYQCFRMCLSFKKSVCYYYIWHAPDTIAWWTKQTMECAGIDTEFFKPYSTRSAAVSKQASDGTSSLKEVLKMGNWRGTSSFFRFYLCRVVYFCHKHSAKNKTPRFSSITFDENNVCHVQCSLAPISSVRQVANQALWRVLSHCQGHPGPPVHKDIPIYPLSWGGGVAALLWTCHALLHLRRLSDVFLQIA